MNGTAYVVLELAEFERLTTLAKAAVLPPLPEPDKNGNVPAVQYARATIARNLIRDRTAAGLTQRQLAKLAGVPVETLCAASRQASAHPFPCQPSTRSTGP